MSALLWLIPIALLMGAAGLAAFMWSLREGQYDDMQGAAERILIDEDKPLVDEARKPAEDADEPERG